MTTVAGGVPFLKWPGGKRWAAETVAQVVSAHLGNKAKYIEPFLGGGAVFFYLRPRRAILSDINESLIEVYQVIREDPSSIIQSLREFPVDRSQFYKLRSTTPAHRKDRTARFLYLNRTAFGGMYRVNRKGEFNVPFGGGERTPEMLWETGILHSAAHALTNVQLLTADFATSMKKAGRGDVVYCDPTYTVAHNNNCFIRYNERNFSWKDQKRLVEEATMAVRRGATVIVSNAYHPAVRGLYKGWSRLILKRPSNVSPNATQRRRTSEYLFALCPQNDCNCLKQN